MKHKRYVAIGAVCVMLCSLVGCQRAELKLLDAFEGAVRIATISTSGLFHHSEVNFYDENLELVQTDDIPYAGILDRGVVENHKLYFPSEGIMDIENLKIMVEYDPKTGAHTKLNMDRPGLLNTAADSQAVYTWNNRNFLTTVTRYDLETGERTIYETQDFIINGFYERGELLYALATDLTDATTNYFVVFDKQTMAVRQKVALGALSCGSDIVEYENNLYFTGITKAFDASYLYQLNLDTYEFQTFPLSQVYPTQTLAFGGDSILIFWNHRNNGKGVSIVNLQTKEETEFTMEHSMMKSCVNGNSVYGFGWDYAVHKYDFDGKKFVHQKEVKVPQDQNAHFGGIYLLAAE